MVAAVKQSYPQREIADAAFELQHEIDTGERIVVGVNRHVHEDETPLPILRIDPALERKQLDRLQAVRARRDGAAVEATLVALREDAAQPRRNLMPALLRVHARARDRGRDRAGAAGRLGLLPRDPRLLGGRARASVDVPGGRRLVPAPRRRRPTPLLMLHGGPGAGSDYLGPARPRRSRPTARS